MVEQASKAHLSWAQEGGGGEGGNNHGAMTTTAQFTQEDGTGQKRYPKTHSQRCSFLVEFFMPTRLPACPTLAEVMR